MGTDCGEPVEKSWPAFAVPLSEIPGPVTVQDFTPVALHVMAEGLFGETRVGLAEMVASGASTSIEANAGSESPPGPVHTT